MGNGKAEVVVSDRLYCTVSPVGTTVGIYSTYIRRYLEYRGVKGMWMGGSRRRYGRRIFPCSDKMAEKKEKKRK